MQPELPQTTRRASACSPHLLRYPIQSVHASCSFAIDMAVPPYVRMVCSSACSNFAFKTRMAGDSPHVGRKTLRVHSTPPTIGIVLCPAHGAEIVLGCPGVELVLPEHVFGLHGPDTRQGNNGDVRAFPASDGDVALAWIDDPVRETEFGDHGTAVT